VRAVLARSFEPAFRRQLVEAGILPLRLRILADERGIHEGDELEIPGLPESLEPGKPVTVRNLARGSQLALPHDLSAREIEVVVAGGLLAFSDPTSGSRNGRP
jgi:aconitate hydratase